MNFKKTLTALAVAGVFATPMAAQADVYASARIGVNNIDTGGNSEMQVNGMAARMGIKGENDLGNGMTGFGKYEFGVNTEGAGPNVTRRHALVGLKGDFGSVTLGQTYHTFYNFAYGPTDLPWWGAGSDAVVLSPGRTAQGLTYAGGAGPVNFGVTLYMDDSATSKPNAANPAGEPENIDGTEMAVSFDAAGIATFALAISDKKGDQGAGDLDPEAVTMITASNIMAGPVTLAVGYQVQDEKVGAVTISPNTLIIHADIMSGYVHYEAGDNDAPGTLNESPTSLTLGYTHSIGPKTTAWFEYQSYDADQPGPSAASDDFDALRAVLKVDF